MADRVAKLRSRCRSAMRICAAIGGMRLRAAVPLGSAKHAWCKRGVSLVSGMNGGIKSVPKECPARASYKSDPQECPTRVSYKSVP